MKYRIKSLYDNILAFFSGEDRGTLHQEGINRSNFVSLVVDTRGTYVAAITRRIEVKTTYTPHSEASYPFFSVERVPVSVTQEPAEVIKQQYVVQWYPLTVVRETVNNEDEYIDRFAKLLTPTLSKANSSKYVPTVYNGYNNQGGVSKGYQSFNDSIKNKEADNTTPSSYPDPYPGFPSSKKKEKVEEPELFEGRTYMGSDYDDMDDYPYYNGYPSYTNDEDDKDEKSEWAEAVSLKSKLKFDKALLGKWLVKLFSGTPLSVVTSHMVWSSQLADTLLKSWENDLNEKEFEEFMTEWISYMNNTTELIEFFDDKQLTSFKELDEVILMDVFFLHIKDEFISSVPYGNYMEIMLTILKEEFGYIF